MKYLLSQKEYNEYQTVQHNLATLHTKNMLLFDALQVIQGIAKDKEPQVMHAKVEFFVNNLFVAFTNSNDGNYEPVKQLIVTFRELKRDEVVSGIPGYKEPPARENHIAGGSRDNSF